MVKTPIDELNTFIGQTVLIELKNGVELTAKFVGFDEMNNINIMLDMKNEVIQGKNVSTISILK